MFLVGVVWFAVASALCGLAPNAETLIAARALQGIGGALLAPGSLAIIESGIAPADRGRAIGAWTGMTSIAAAIGPFIGGALVQYADWRWIFWINAPLAAATVAVSMAFVPESRTAEPRVGTTGSAPGSRRCRSGASPTASSSGTATSRLPALVVGAGGRASASCSSSAGPRTRCSRSGSSRRARSPPRTR